MNLDPTPEQARFTDDLRPAAIEPSLGVRHCTRLRWIWSIGWTSAGDGNARWPTAATSPSPGRRRGGNGLGPVEHFIVQQELAVPGPGAGRSPGARLVGPTLLAHGTAGSAPAGSAAARRVRGGVSSSASRMPGATWRRPYRRGRWRRLAPRRSEGVDLLRAVCRLGCVLARTDPAAPKHAGLSYFVVNMATPASSAGRWCR
jgi:hypothetical protein